MTRRDDWTGFVLFSALYWIFWYLLLILAGLGGQLPPRYLPVYIALSAIPYLVSGLITGPWWPRPQPMKAPEKPDAPATPGERWAARIVFGLMLALFSTLSVLGLLVIVRVLLGLAEPPSQGLPFFAFETGLVSIMAVLLGATVVKAWRQARDSARREAPQK